MAKEVDGIGSESFKGKAGPHGLGDPNDTFLRKVEKEVLIPKIIRDRAREEKCIEEVAAFSKCGKDNGLLLWLKCRQENDILKSCLAKWWYKEEFREECKQVYLKDRAEFRRTGLTVKQRKAAEENAKNAKHV